MDFTGCAEAPNLSFDGDHYDLLQIHIHSPSEHMVRRAGRASCRDMGSAKAIEDALPSVFFNDSQRRSSPMSEKYVHGRFGVSDWPRIAGFSRPPYEQLKKLLQSCRGI